MSDVVRILPRHVVMDPEADPHLREEWLVTNGLGGYASGTVAGAMTRRYHGWLIAALPNPLGRMMMLNALSERLLPAQRGNRRFGHPRRISVHHDNRQAVGGITPFWDCLSQYGDRSASLVFCCFC